MTAQKHPLYFVGHKGQMRSLDLGNTNTMYIPDSNLVLSILQSASTGTELSGKRKHYLSASKQAVNLLWHQNKKWIPVNPVLAIMELTKQNEAPNYQSYLAFYREFFEGIYNILDVAPEWVLSSYIAALNAHVNTHPSITKTVEQIYSFCPPNEKPSDSEAIYGCENFFNWIWKERKDIAIIGGPLMYIAVYAICGSPQARAFIKYAKRSTETAKNVAWDILYWVMLELDYHLGKYENTVVCTSDRALCELLSSRINNGPRGGISASATSEYVESYGKFEPVKLKSLENTKLENKIGEKLAELLAALEAVETESIKFGSLGGRRRAGKVASGRLDLS